MFERQGRRLSLSLSRRLICDLMHASHKVPGIPMERRMKLAPLAAARLASPIRIGWCALFIKAYALVASRRSELRRAYLTFPYPHLYEHPTNVASVAVERRLDDEDAVLMALIQAPENCSLADLQAELDRNKHDPVETIASFRRALRLSRWPVPVRRLIWWFGLSVSGECKARHFGTFGVSVTAGLGASQLLLRSPLSTTLYYGPMDESGEIDVRVVFDHRIMDGATVAALADLEDVLLGEILDELPARAVRKAA